MAKVQYRKPALSYADQLAQLKERGLLIENEPFFLEVLEKKSYYRLSGYWYPLLVDKRNHVFKDGASFAQAYGMYCFDRDLRQLIVKELEKIEISVRAKMIYVFSYQFGPSWYINPEYFKKPHIHNDTLKKIRTEFNRIDAQFIQALNINMVMSSLLLGLHLRLFHLEQFHDYFQMLSLGKVNGSLPISSD